MFSEKKETVYSNANKQYLIFQPPAVLTLHLKRFEQVHIVVMYILFSYESKWKIICIFVTHLSGGTFRFALVHPSVC